MSQHANQALPGGLFLFLKRNAEIGQHQQSVGRSILAEDGLAQQPARRRSAEGTNGLIRRGQQIVEAQVTRKMAKASRGGAIEEFEAGVVDELQAVFAIEGEERRVHYLQDARQQRGSLKRAHALLLQEIGKRVDLAGKFAEGIAGGGAARAKGVVAFAQRRNHVGERLQGANEAVYKAGSDKGEVNEKAKAD